MPGAPSALELTRLFRVTRGEDIESVLRRVIVRGRLIQRRGRERSDRPACRLVEFGAAGVRSITGYDRVGEARAAARGEGDG